MGSTLSGSASVMNRTLHRIGATSAWRLESRSPDGRIAFALHRSKGCLYAERHQIDPSAGRLVQSALFRDEASFVRWCEADTAKFEYPLMCGRLRRAGCELLARTAQDGLPPGDFGGS